jgi:hypothetical protein
MLLPDESYNDSQIEPKDPITMHFTHFAGGPAIWVRDFPEAGYFTGGEYRVRSIEGSAGRAAWRERHQAYSNRVKRKRKKKQS